MQYKFFILIRPDVNPEVFLEVQEVIFDLTKFLKSVLVVIDVVHLILMNGFKLTLGFYVGLDGKGLT